jgi:hypothetical protein
MKLRVIELRESGKVDLLSNPKPDRSWCKDGVIRWVNVEHATADLVTGDNWYDWIEQDDFFIKANAAPTAWFKDEKWYHMIVLPETIVTIHRSEIHRSG